MSIHQLICMLRESAVESIQFFVESGLKKLEDCCYGCVGCGRGFRYCRGFSKLRRAGLRLNCSSSFWLEGLERSRPKSVS